MSMKKTRLYSATSATWQCTRPVMALGKCRGKSGTAMSVWQARTPVLSHVCSALTLVVHINEPRTRVSGFMPCAQAGSPKYTWRIPSH